MQYNLIKDLCSLTSIRQFIFTKLANIATSCICDYVREAILSDEDIIEVNIGIGTLVIQLQEDEIEYQFIPVNRLEKGLIEVALGGNNPLTKALEENLNAKLYSTYKDVL